MIERLIEVLQEAGLLLEDKAIISSAWTEEQSLLRDEDIADALWLTTLIGSDEITAVLDQESSDTTDMDEKDGESEDQPLPSVSVYPPKKNDKSETDEYEMPATGLPLTIQAAPALPNALGVGRALRPLMRKVSSRTRQALDELATVDRVAEEDIWLPVMQPAKERWLNLELVIEATSYSFVWKPTLIELQKVLEQQGAFRNVRTWWVREDETGKPALTPKTRQGFPLEAGIASSHRSPYELIEASGRTLVLYVSDCRSRLWQKGIIHDWLRLWSLHGPTTVAQLLPERLWGLTELKAGFKIQIQSLSPGAANHQLRLYNSPTRRRFSDDQALILPIISLSVGSLQQWAWVVSAVGQQRLPARLFDVGWVKNRKRLAEANWAAIEPQTPKARVELFNATASAAAQRLARLMSVVPVDLSVVHLIQQVFFRDVAEPVHIAEVYESCLIERRKAFEDTGQIQYDFVPGVRALLNPRNSIDETLNVLDAISQEIARTIGFEINSFTALLSVDLNKYQDKKDAILPFAKITTQVLHRLGGDYKELAKQVEKDIHHHEFLLQPPQPRQTSSASVSSTKKAIYLAEVPIGLEDERDSLRRDLVLNGYQVLPSEPLPNDSNEFRKAVQGYLQTSQLSVHLLNHRPRNITRPKVSNRLSYTFVYDIFISYAHIDNQSLSPEQEGWISTFHKALQIRLSQIRGTNPKVWRDLKLDGNDFFGDTILEGLSSSSLLVSILSPRYLKSESCMRELQTFCQVANGQTGGIRVGDNKSRLFKVVKTHVPLDQFPPELAPLIGYEFFEFDANRRPLEFSKIYGSELERKFHSKLNDLAYDIHQTLEILETSAASASEPVSSVSTYSELFQELSFERSETQINLAAQASQNRPDFNRIIWMPPTAQLSDGDDFLKMLQREPDFVSTGLEDLKTIIQDRLIGGESEPKITTDGLLKVYLDCDQRDLDSADIEPLYEWLDQRFEVLLPDTNLSLRSSETLIQQCDVVVIYYGRANSLWLRRRINALRKSLYKRAKPLLARAIYVAPNRQIRITVPEDIPIYQGTEQFNADTLISSLNQFTQQKRTEE